MSAAGIEVVETGKNWLAATPAHWQIARLGQYFVERRETVSDVDYVPLSVTKDGVVPQLENAAKTDYGDNRKRVVSGDFVINSRSDRRGSAGVSQFDGSVSTISIVLTPRGIDGRFAHYLLRSQPFQEEFYRFGSGIVADLWSTRWAQMRDIKIPVPPPQEQRSTVEYLDREIGRIDSLIDKQNQLRELILQRRDALMEESQEGARSVRLGRVLTKLDRPVGSETEVLTAYRDGQVTRRSQRREEGYTFAAATDGYQGVRPGDLVFHGLDGFAGAVGIAEAPGICSPVYHVARSRAGADVRFVALALQSLAAHGYVEAYGNSVRQRSVDYRNWAFFSGLSVRIPLMPVQRDVVEKHERGLAILRRDGYVVELLRERRQALVAAAVTGQLR